MEKGLYRSLHEAGITCITISKRLALEEFHSTHLSMGVASPEGWTMEEL